MIDLDEFPSYLSSDFGGEAVRPLISLAVAIIVAVITDVPWRPSRHDGLQDNLPTLTSEQQRSRQLANQSMQEAVFPASTQLIVPEMRWSINKVDPGLHQIRNALLINHTKRSISMPGLVIRSRGAGMIANKK